MRQNDFIATLEKAMAEMKPEERREILSDFQEHFASGMAGGKTEEEIARELGDPEGLAAQFTEGTDPDTSAGRKKLTSRDVLAVAGLLLFDVFIAVNVIGTLFVVWVALWAVDVAIFAGALAGFVAPVLFTPWLPSAMSSVGLVCLGVALLALCALWSIGMCYVSKWSYRGLVEFIKLHVRIFKGA
ncbi:MAG: DUF1700 domain-containing protein [Acidobacteriota bacterium]|jgi:uncharacterized membrane protein|nr:DUF1700 domain-containing protein [Acidobacteriota bacterium]